MFFDITHAQHHSEYRISLELKDEARGRVDLSDYIKPDTVSFHKRHAVKASGLSGFQLFYFPQLEKPVSQRIYRSI